VLVRVRDARGAGRWPPGAAEVSTGQAGSAEGGILIRLHVLRAPRPVERGAADGPGASQVHEARFQAFGCPVAIACASWLAEWACGKSFAELGSLSGEVICRALELQPGDASTADLALTALRGALAQHGPPGR
jgi:hypothetical protein